MAPKKRDPRIDEIIQQERTEYLFIESQNKQLTRKVKARTGSNKKSSFKLSEIEEEEEKVSDAASESLNSCE
jgi:hypothetical protein